MDAAVADLRRLAATGSYFAGEAPPSIVSFDEQSEAEWYADAVESTSSPTYRLWAAGQAGWYGLDPDALGASNLFDYYATDTPGADERYTIHGGNDQVATRILDALPSGTGSGT